MYFISDEAGIAYESVEGGLAKFDPKTDDFTDLMSPSEMDFVFDKSMRRVSADEALAFARSKAAASEVPNPHA
ncbi:MAG: hypothetical protein J6V72_13965 [Kiritimatiellae bacterium]|nr:hypothetical protein [Kiritimatiellia bacterium]